MNSFHILLLRSFRLPLFSKLSETSNYIFSTIGVDGVHIELYDEQKPISSLQPFMPLLVLVEPEGNREEKVLAQNISRAMGISLLELEKNLDQETESFRLSLFDVCLEAEKERGIEGAQHYAFVEEPIIASNSNSIGRGPAGPDGSAGSAEIHEMDLDYVQYPEDPDEVNRRVMEKLKRKIQFSDAYLGTYKR